VFAKIHRSSCDQYAIDLARQGARIGTALPAAFIMGAVVGAALAKQAKLSSAVPQSGWVRAKC